MAALGGYHEWEEASLTLRQGGLEQKVEFRYCRSCKHGHFVSQAVDRRLGDLLEYVRGLRGEHRKWRQTHVVSDQEQP